MALSPRRDTQILSLELHFWLVLQRKGSWTDLFPHRASVLSLFRHNTFYIRAQIQISQTGRLESKLSGTDFHWCEALRTSNDLPQ